MSMAEQTCQLHITLRTLSVSRVFWRSWFIDGPVKRAPFALSEDDVSGRAWMSWDEERVLRGRWVEMRLWRYGGWIVVRTL